MRNGYGSAIAWLAVCCGGMGGALWAISRGASAGYVAGLGILTPIGQGFLLVGVLLGALWLVVAALSSDHEALTAEIARLQRTVDELVRQTTPDPPPSPTTSVPAERPALGSSPRR